MTAPVPCTVCGWYGGDHAPTCPGHVSTGRKAGGVVIMIFCIMVLLGVIIGLASAWSS